MSLIGYLCKKEFIQDCRCDACRKTLPEKTYEELTELKRQNEIMVEALKEIVSESHSSLCESMKPYRPNYTCHVEIAEEALAKCGKVEK